LSASEDAALAILLRLFLLQESVALERVRDRLGERALRFLDRLGFLRPSREHRGGAQLVATVQISLHGELRVVSDRDPRPGEPGRREVVFGPTSATLALAQLTPRGRVRRALDVGTGTGFLALRLAEHADEVLATDVLPRAVELAALNASLNARANVRAAVSDRFTSLAGERFDLVTGNLPFVISPERRYVYRDAGGETFLASVLEAVPKHLSPQGWALFLAQWPLLGERSHGPEGERLWSEAHEKDAGCDMLALVAEREPTDRYAARWSAGPAPRDRGERDRRFDAWMRHYDREGIMGVATGLLVLRPARWPRPLVAQQDCPELGEMDGDAVRSRFLAWRNAAGPRRRAARG
jgi:SAM-dependent methyltransferase